MSSATRAELLQGGVGDIDPASLDRWRSLAELRESPFLTPEWSSAWLASHPDEKPFVVLWRRGEELRGVLPLVRARRGPLRVLRPVGARRVDWFTPACERGDEAAMGRDCTRLLSGEARRWDLLALNRVDPDSGWPQALWEEGGIAPARHRRTDVLPYVSFDEGGYEGYLASRSRNFRSQLKRRRRKLEEEHGLSFRLTREAGELDADFEVFLRLHEERWKDRGGSSSGAADVKDFHRRFAAAALERGWLRLWIAEADGAPAASWYGWQIGGRCCYALSGLDSRFERLSLGTVLLAHTIEQAAAEGAKVYDMMWGDEAYKERFETGRRETASWALVRRSNPVRPAVAALIGTERALRRVRGR
jgi:CelD/BcsL family acetyltransferase involved in cellulose biosynthesis